MFIVNTYNTRPSLLMLGPSRRSGACFVSLSLSSPSTASPSSIGLVGACEGSNICVLFVCVCVCVGGGGGGGGGGEVWV